MAPYSGPSSRREYLPILPYPPFRSPMKVFASAPAARARRYPLLRFLPRARSSLLSYCGWILLISPEQVASALEAPDRLQFVSFRNTHAWFTGNGILPARGSNERPALHRRRIA